MAKLDRDALMVQDLDFARKTLVHEGKKPDERQLGNDIHEDWEILGRSRQLPEAEKAEITDAVWRLIKTHRALAQIILPAGILEKNFDFYKLMVILDGVLDLKISGKKIFEDEIGIIARTKRTVARNIIQPKLVHHVDQQVNRIIDSNDDKALEDVIERIIAYLKHECLGKDVEGIAFYLVNEENYQGQVEKLTKITIGIPETKMEKSQFERGKEDLGLFETNGEKPQVITDHQTNKLYFELKIKGQQLGILEIDVKPTKQLTKIEMEYVRQAMSRLDTQIDEAMHSKRLKLITQEAHRILDEYDAQENFEEGIAKFMELVCLYSTAYEAEVMVDIFGDGEDWFAKRFNDDREITPIEMDTGMKAEIKIPARSRRVDEKLALVLDIADNTSKKTEGNNNIIGKVIFRTKNDSGNLTNEDHTILTLCSEILSSHILSWRNNLNLRTEGVDPQIARTTMREGIEDIIKETLTVFYTDIAGYTYICEILKEALEDEETTKDIETLRAVLEKFLNLIQHTGQMYGGVWDKAVGDMGLMEFGPPVGKNGLDPLGNNFSNRRPEYFACNALKAAILVRHKLTEVTAVFRTKLLEIAYKKYSSGLKPLEELSPEDHDILLKKLEDETRLSPKISTTTSVYTGEVGFMKLKLGAAHDWTAIGDAMNSAARVQGTSMKMEIRVPLLTRDLVMPLINMDLGIPYNSKDEKETWSEFFRDKLGMDPEKVKVDFFEYYEGYKNKTGRNVVFTLNLKEAKTGNIAPNSVITFNELLQYEGEEFAIGSRRPAEGNMTSFRLRTVTDNPEDSVTFKVMIPPGAIDERMTRYKSPLVLNKRKKLGAHNTLLVQDGKLKEFEWESIEVDQKAELTELAKELQKSEEKMIVFTKMVPTGCYELSSMNDHRDPRHALLGIRKDNYVFDVRVSRSKIHEGISTIMKDNEVLYDFQSYYEVIRNKITSDRPVVFVRKRHFYIVDPKEAETYIMPILTRAESDSSREITKTTSNPPDAENGHSDCPQSDKKLVATKGFWSKISQQAEAWKQGGNYLLWENWNSNFKKPEEKK